MTNYEAIMKMPIRQLEAFLDEVYCAGLNNGMYAAGLDDEESMDILGDNPFSVEWLIDKAEPAVLPDNPLCDEHECLNALVKAIFRSTGITNYEEGE